MQLSDYTVKLLNDIENRIDPDVEEDYIGQWRDFWAGGISTPIFSPKRKVVSTPSLDIQPMHINDCLLDYELMLDMQLEGISSALSGGRSALTMRSNYGTGILGSLFGAEIFTMPREQKTLPTVRSFGDTDKIRSLLDKGVPPLDIAFGKNVFEFGEYCAEIFKNYPKISKYVYMIHPDTQGPLDIAELLWGGEMFYEMYDDPDFVHEALTLITETYTAFLKRWYEIIPMNTDINPYWTDWAYLWHKGTLMIRNDSAMNLSPEFYREFAMPYDILLLDRFGGGCIHFCGRGDHYIDAITEIKGLYAINMSQPHLNDMEKIFRHTVDRGIKILAFNKGWAEKLKDREGGYHHNLSI